MSSSAPPASGLAPGVPVPVVLDTNVCLDLFVFADPRATALADGLARGRLQAITDVHCRDEWCRVLAYPQWALSVEAQTVHRGRFDAQLTMLDDAPCPPGVPRCRDPDDQKFLALAARAGARWLFTRDAELLRLSRRTQRDWGFAILTPQAWAGQWVD